MNAELKDRQVRPRHSIFLIAATSFALTFTTLGVTPAGANQQDSASGVISEESEITRLLISYEPGVSPVNASGDITGQSYVPSVELQDVERVGKNIFTVDLPSAVTESEAMKIADDLEKSPLVRIVEPDLPISLSVTDPRNTQTTNTSGLWGLDRIDQRSSTLNGTYNFDSTGVGVDAYVIDGGIYPHNEFQGRLELGYSAIVDAVDTPTLRHSIDCDRNGHGTHVAGILGGTTYGVAKEVSLYPVQVFDCDGKGNVSTLIRGIDWAIRHHQTNQPAVANMSLGVTEKSFFLDVWVQALINDGVHVVVASGNSNVDACNYSPASTPGTVTVNSAGQSGIRSSFSNFGACTDIFAPGESILSASNSDEASTAIMSGTSMASPFVAGAVAKILEANPTFNRSQVVSELLDNSTPFVSNKLRDPSRLLYSPAIVTLQQELANPVLRQELLTISSTATQTQASLEAAEAARLAEIARLAELKRLAEIERIANEKAAADKLAADQAAAAEAAKIAASLPVVKKSLKVKALKKKRVSVAVAAPSGSRTFVQRKVGKKWRTVVSTTAVPSMVVKVPRAGTYRVRVEIPAGTITSKTVRVR